MKDDSTSVVTLSVVPSGTAKEMRLFNSISENN